MKLYNVISAERVFNLIKRDISENAVRIYVVSGASAGIIILLSAYTTYSGISSYVMYNKFFAILVFFAGLITTSGSFREMHLKNESQHFLLLPASHFEKFITRLILTTIGFSLFTLLGMVIVSYLSEGINSVLFGSHNYLFNPFDPSVWLIMARYTALQSIFFLGAVFFRKNNFIKTINVLLAAAFILFIIIMIFFRLFYADMFQRSFIMQENRIVILLNTLAPYLRIFRIILWVVPAPLFWTIAYFRITEAEVKNAI